MMQIGPSDHKTSEYTPMSIRILLCTVSLYIRKLSYESYSQTPVICDFALW
jgi:hypothetical protein